MVLLAETLLRPSASMAHQLVVFTCAPAAADARPLDGAVVVVRCEELRPQRLCVNDRMQQRICKHRAVARKAQHDKGVPLQRLCGGGGARGREAGAVYVYYACFWQFGNLVGMTDTRHGVSAVLSSKFHAKVACDQVRTVAVTSHHAVRRDALLQGIVVAKREGHKASVACTAHARKVHHIQPRMLRV